MLFEEPAAPPVREPWSSVLDWLFKFGIDPTKGLEDGEILFLAGICNPPTIPLLDRCDAMMSVCWSYRSAYFLLRLEFSSDLHWSRAFIPLIYKKVRCHQRASDKCARHQSTQIGSYLQVIYEQR